MPPCLTCRPGWNSRVSFRLLRMVVHLRNLGADVRTSPSRVKNRCNFCSKSPELVSEFCRRLTGVLVLGEGDGIGLDSPDRVLRMYSVVSLWSNPR